MKKVFSVLILIMFLFVKNGQSQSFYSSADVLSFLNENSFSNNSTTLNFSQNGAFLKIGSSLFNNPTIKVISKSTAYVKYFSINNPSIVASLFVEKNGSYIIDRSSNTKYEMSSAFDQLERIRLGENYNETSEERGKRLYEEMIIGERREEINKEKYLTNSRRIVYHPEGEVNEKKDTFYTSDFRNKYNSEKKKFIDLAGSKIGFDVIDVGNKFIELGNVFPDTINYVEAQNILKKAGGGWRLPTKNEMQSIMNLSPIKYRDINSYLGKRINKYWTSSKENAFIWISNITNYDYFNYKAEIYKGDLRNEKSNSFIPVRDVKIKTLKTLYDYYFIGKPLLIDGEKLLQYDFKLILEEIKKATRLENINYTVFDEKKIISTSGDFNSKDDVQAFLNESKFSLNENDRFEQSFKFSEKGTNLTCVDYGTNIIYNNPVIESITKGNADITYSLVKDPRRKIKITLHKYGEFITEYGKYDEKYKRKVDIGKIIPENWFSYLNDIIKVSINGKDSVKVNSMKFEVCQYIYPNHLPFNQHKKIIQSIGNGWRLPTVLEFHLINILDRHSFDIPKLANEYSNYQNTLYNRFDLEGGRQFLINYNGDRLMTSNSFYELKNSKVLDYFNNLKKYEIKNKELMDNIYLILVRSLN